MSRRYQVSIYIDVDNVQQLYHHTRKMLISEGIEAHNVDDYLKYETENGKRKIHIGNCLRSVIDRGSPPGTSIEDSHADPINEYGEPA